MGTTDTFRPHAAPLPAPRFPDAADGGLGYDDVLRSPDRNLLCLVGPWDGFEDGDTVQILVGPDRRIFGSAPASATDQDSVVDVYVPARNFSFLADGLHDTVARVVNALGLPVDSIVVPVRLKLSVPGGPDPVADTPYRNENLRPPEVSPAVIGPDTGTATVTVRAWDNMAEEDQLVLRWGVAGNEQVHDVVASEGQVRARRNGSVTITVRDAANQTASFQVTVTNAWIMEHIGWFIWNGAVQYQRPGGHLPTGEEMNWNIGRYWQPWPLPQGEWWSSDVHPSPFPAQALRVNVFTSIVTWTLKAAAYDTLSIYR